MESIKAIVIEAAGVMFTFVEVYLISPPIMKIYGHISWNHKV